MSVQVVSTTDSAETVTAAMGDLAAKPEPVKETKSAPAEKSEGESTEASEASETEGQELESAAADESDETDSHENEESKEDDKPKKKNGFKKRIDKLNKRATLAEQNAEYWRQEALKSRGQEPKPDDKSKKTVDLDAKPKVEDFDSHSAYVEALTDWKVEQKAKAIDQRAREEQLKSAHQKQIDQHLAKVKSFQEAHDDFEDVIDDVNDVKMSLTVQEAILQSENGPELMYALAKNREEYERICELPPIQAARAIGRFESKFVNGPAEEKQETKKTTAAPKPLSTVSRTATQTRRSIYDPNLSQAEFEQMRKEQEKRAKASQW